jgi:hypothetical protein
VENYRNGIVVLGRASGKPAAIAFRFAAHGAPVEQTMSEDDERRAARDGLRRFSGNHAQGDLLGVNPEKLGIAAYLQLNGVVPPRTDEAGCISLRWYEIVSYTEAGEEPRRHRQSTMRRTAGRSLVATPIRWARQASAGLKLRLRLGQASIAAWRQGMPWLVALACPDAVVPRSNQEGRVARERAPKSPATSNPPQVNRL